MDAGEARIEALLGESPDLKAYRFFFESILRMKAHTLTLEDGTIYMLPGVFKDPGLKIGEKVSVLWNKKSGAGSSNEERDAVSVTIVK